MNNRKLLQRLSKGDLQNVAFQDMLRLALAFRFEERRIRGSHHILSHPGIPCFLNLQETGGQAKPYQIRQFLKLVERYNLGLEGEP